MPSLLSQKAVLASLSISQWSARKPDKRATEEIHARNHADPHAGRYNKLLIAKEGLQKVQHAAGEARTFHYAMTQPWLDDGARLLPSALFIDYANRIRDLKAEFEAVGAQRVGISADEVDKQLQFSDKHGFDYPLLSDPDKTVATTFGVKRGFGPNKRTTFVIDTDQTILAVIASEISMAKHADKALEVLRARANSN